MAIKATPATRLSPRWIPPQPIAGRAGRKTTFLWLFVRGGLAALGVEGVSMLVAIGVIGVVVALVHTDVVVLRERLFLENLGVGRTGILRFAAGITLALELLLAGFFWWTA